VIEAEKEIQKCLESEKTKVREWLEGVKKESDEAFLREQSEIRESLEESLKEAARQADIKADEIVREATAASERIGRLNAEALRSIIQRRISEILPG
jgi:vacuolar-type H+-ATPase subunit H